MIFYLTVNDSPSGIYSSQVIDVVKFIKSEFKVPIKLVAFISIRHFLFNRKKIKLDLQDAIILPMFPGVKNWRLNNVLLTLICSTLKPKIIIARSVIATQLAFKHNRTCKIVYDGRGAIAEEWKEYGVITDNKMLAEIEELEKECVIKSDFRIAVSNELVLLWTRKYGYHLNNHVIIPCTLNKLFEYNLTSLEKTTQLKKELNFSENDLIFIYSGSVAGWQSFNLIQIFVKSILNNNNNCKFLFLSEEDENIKQLKIEFKEKINCKKVEPSQVPMYLSVGNFGLLIRENSITNKVASPVKFAEYLSCGLPVIISEKLGDYSAFIKTHECGFSVNEFNNQNMNKEFDKQKIREIALSNFSKTIFKDSYIKVIS